MTNLINVKEIQFEGKNSILCGVLRDCEVVLEKHGEDNYKLTLQDGELKEFFHTIKVGTLEEIKSYYKNTFGAFKGI